MNDSMREMVSRYIEQYHLTEKQGQFSFELEGQTFTLQNFGSLHGTVTRFLAYAAVRGNLQNTMDIFQRAIDLESPELWKEALSGMADTYEPFIEFALINESQFISFFETIERMTHGKTAEALSSIVYTMLDVAGMCDHAVSYGVYLVREFQRMIEEEDFESLMENQDKFPVAMKIAHSKKEADQWIKEQIKKDKHPEEKSNDLKRMKTIGGMQ